MMNPRFGAALAVFLLACLASAQGCADWQSALRLANWYRSRYGAPLQKWNKTLEAQSLAWAQAQARNKCNLQSDSSKRQGSGENLYGTYGSTNATCVSAIRNWAAGATKFKYTNKPWTDNIMTFAQWGAWTQTIWKASQQIGCAGAANKDANCYVIVCRYYPSGNIITDAQFLANVGKPVPTTPSPPKPPSPPPRPPSPPVKPSTCVDKSSFCPTAAARGWCTYTWSSGNDIGKLVKSTCPKSCKAC